MPILRCRPSVMLCLLFCICMPQMHQPLLLVASTSSQTSQCHARDWKQQSKLQLLQGHEVCLPRKRWRVVCKHKPADWINRPQGTLRKRQRDDEDDVITLDYKPGDQIDKPLDVRKRRHKELR
ncbi:hypothetical protein EV702DRAFT_1042421 [Suillus placidus]|uniref:Secreted protein n=1 Tax=Suillus placidus TaxID=48579 RepID=A0A9P7A4I3_9AGAM|nr:hypothetical protein EV702DRAFT_1042421 [Suillus placidus]